MAGLLLRGGRVIDPASGLDAARDVVVRDGRIDAVVESGSVSAGPGDEVRDVAGAIVTPGLWDLHGHWYAGSAYGIDASACLRGGVTTTVDAGTTGYLNWHPFRAQSVETAPVHVRAFLHVAALGIPWSLVGELEDVRFARPKEAAALIRAERDRLVGVKVRLSACGGDVATAFGAAHAAADAAGVPLMVDVGTADDGMPGVLDSMVAGDILTHCFTGAGRGIVGMDGRVAPEAWAARRRGVRFDVGHGRGSFSFATARAALAEGFTPHSVSTDLHRFSVESPVVDLPTTMAKFLHLGLSLPDVVSLVTVGAAESVGLPSPALSAGAPADIAVLRTTREPVSLMDATGSTEVASAGLVAELTIVGGRVVIAADVPLDLRPLVAADREESQPRPR